MSANDFTEEQKKYLEGFFSGANLAREALGAPGAHKLFPGTAIGTSAVAVQDVHEKARQRFVSEGKKLVPEEEAKAKAHPFDLWDQLVQWSKNAEFPKGTDVFLMKFHGMFYVAPAQNSFMCRLRIPGGFLSAYQLRGLARLADDYANKSADITTRANFQLREIGPASTIDFLNDLCELGLTSRGSGADNVRNVTGSPTSGIDPQELIETQPYCRAMHHHILNHRELYGLPRKFNIAFDGAGKISSFDETNDIGFYAVKIGEGTSVPAGVYFRVRLGGITGHKDFAVDEGIVIEPSQAVEVADAMLRVFIETGDRTDRKKARMKYVLDAIGHPKYLELTEEKLGWKFVRFPLEDCEVRPEAHKWGHVGFHRQKQEGKVYAGVVIPVGKMTSEQMRQIADLSDKFGSGEIRLTVWQNLIVPNIDEGKTTAFEKELSKIGFTTKPSSLKSALVACTGSAGCKYGNAETKGNAVKIAEYVDARLTLDQAVNVHVTGCPNSCAQHYVGDIGLIGCKVEISEDEEVDGFNIFLGGGYGKEQAIAQEFLTSVKAEHCPQVVHSLLKTYLDTRTSPEESFHAFAARVGVETLKTQISIPEVTA